MKTYNFCIIILFLLGFQSCGSIKFTNDYISASTFTKSTEPSVIEKQNWYNLDISDDSIPGMSVDKAYKELLRGLRADTVIVAVIDTGIDIYHQDLQGLIWVNENEIPNNGKDDDQNGYIDDIHGWNYLEDAYDETLEMTRLLRDKIIYNRKFEDAKSEINQKIKETKENLNRYEGYVEGFKKSKKIISEYLNKENFSSDELESIEDESVSADIFNAKEFLSYFYSIDISLDYLIEGKEYFEEQSKYHYNINFNGRKSSDNIYDINDINYGDYRVNNIKPTESHGTHVAGIIAGIRNNSIGNNGINNHVKIIFIHYRS